MRHLALLPKPHHTPRLDPKLHLQEILSLSPQPILMWLREIPPMLLPGRLLLKPDRHVIAQLPWIWGVTGSSPELLKQDCLGLRSLAWTNIVQRDRGQMRVKQHTGRLIFDGGREGSVGWGLPQRGWAPGCVSGATAPHPTPPQRLSHRYHRHHRHPVSLRCHWGPLIWCPQPIVAVCLRLQQTVFSRALNK